MLKQKFCLLKAPKNNALFILSCALIMLFGFVVILPAVPEKTFAEGDDPNEGIVITISPEINASLISSENGDYKIVKDTVTISTDALNGYTLYVSTDTPQHQTLYLNGDTSSENRINGANGTYESPKTLGDYEWGFAVPGVGHFDDAYSAESPNEDSKFAILPTENKIIRDYTTSASEDAAEVYYGFKLGGTIEPGAYETNITYTAIPATQPLTAKAVLGDNGNLNFLYDRKTYTAGETYEDNFGETEISAVYSVPVNSSSNNKPGWTANGSVKSANFESSFTNFRPTSTSFWFYDDYYLNSITRAMNLNTSSVTDMSFMFQYAGSDAIAFNLDLSSLNTSSVTDMSYMFQSAGRNVTVWNIGDLSGWDTSSVTNMVSMFVEAGYNATAWNIGDLSGWNTGNVINMSSMFSRAGYSATTFNLDLSGWNTGNVVNMSYMFDQAGYDATTWSIGDISGWDVAKVTNHRSFILSNRYQSNISVVNNQPHWNS